MILRTDCLCTTASASAEKVGGEGGGHRQCAVHMAAARPGCKNAMVDALLHKQA